MSDTAQVLQLNRDMLGELERYVPDLAESGLLVDGETFGTLTGIHPRTVRDLALRGVAVKVGADRYDLTASLIAYTSHLRAMAAGRIEGARTEPGSIDEQARLSGAYERARLNKEKADAEALKNAVTRRELVSAKEVEREWFNVLRQLRSKIMAVPARVRQKLAHLTTSDIATMDAELRRALEDMAQSEPVGEDSADDE